MSRFIRLTRVLTDLNEQGKNKIRESVRGTLNAGEQNFTKKTDDYGRTADYYREMGISVPEELLGSSDDAEVEFQEVDIELVKEDWTETESAALVNLDYVETLEELEHFTLVGYQSGAEIYVRETIEEIEKLIK